MTKKSKPDEDYSARLIQRLEEASVRNDQVLRNSEIARTKNELARAKLSQALPVLSKTFQGNQVILSAIHEIHKALEEDGKELSNAIIELKQVKDLLETATDSLETAIKLLAQAGFDFANIQTFSKGEVWLGNHLPTIRRAIDVFNIPLLEIALDDADKERFEDIAHAVKRSGEKRSRGDLK
jgi:hypothetical protein